MLGHHTASQRAAERRFALFVAVAFVAVGLTWVLLSDVVLHLLARDAVQEARLGTAKGWLFVLLAGAALYGVLRRNVWRLTRTQGTLFAVIDSIADGVLILGSDRTIAHANPAAARLLRCDAAELVGMGAAEFSRRFRVSRPDGSLLPPEELVSQRVFDQAGPLRHKIVIHPPGGAELVVVSTAAAIRMEEGVPAARVVSVMHDVTEVERLDELRDHFFAAAAHSLKTPVTIIQANAQSIARTAPPGLVRAMSSIQRQCHRIDRLVGNLLLLARLRSGTLRLHPEPTELGALVREVAREMAGAARDHGVTADVRANVRVHADPERLAMALRNVIDRALRSAREGSHVLVRLDERERDAAIDVRYLARSDEELSDAFLEHDDMGVSRHVTQAVVRAHGGELLEDVDGGDATASIRLPAIEDRDAAH